MRTFLKKLAKKLPIKFTRNQQYDALTIRILKKVCLPDSNCVDIGCHKGEVLDLMLQIAPEGWHFGFEPIPSLFEDLTERYKGRNCTIFNLALSDEKSTSSFNYVTSNPAYSGLIKRKYDHKDEKDTMIQVSTNRLSDVLPEGVPVDFIKIDVEGGEYKVLQGAFDLILKSKPVIIFEHGMGASDLYGTTPEMVWQFFESLGYHIFLLGDFLHNRPYQSLESFKEQFYKRKNYYFVAGPEIEK